MVNVWVGGILIKVLIVNNLSNYKPIKSKVMITLMVMPAFKSDKRVDYLYALLSTLIIDSFIVMFSVNL